MFDNCKLYTLMTPDQFCTLRRSIIVSIHTIVSGFLGIHVETGALLLGLPKSIY